MVNYLFHSSLSAEEVDRRISVYHGWLLTGFSFGSAVVLLTLGVIFVNVSHLLDFLHITGILYMTLGITFICSGTLLALALSTGKKVLIHCWFGIAAGLVVIHLVDLGYKVAALIDNGLDKEGATLDILGVATFYGLLFAAGITAVLVECASIGIMLRYRGYLVRGERPANVTHAPSVKQHEEINMELTYNR